jgi:hypothetical protein
VKSQDIMDAAPGLYGYQPFAKLDTHTIGCKAEGISYVPIPRARGNLAGFLDVSLSATSLEGARLTVAVSQITSQSATLGLRGQAGVNALSHVPPSRRAGKSITWRRIAGNFRLAVIVQDPKIVRPVIERNFSLLRWIFEGVPTSSRWRPIFVQISMRSQDKFATSAAIRRPSSRRAAAIGGACNPAAPMTAVLSAR